MTPAASNLTSHLPPIPSPAIPYDLRTRVVAWVTTFIGVTVPILGLAAAMVLSWGWGFSWVDLGLLVGMYLATMIGVTAGWHRLFTHRSFQTVAPVQFVLAVLGSMTFQGPLIPWVGRHRQHHQHSDAEGDPHSPHPHGAGFWGVLRGFWHAHIGWAFAPMPDDLDRFAGDIKRSPMLRFVSAMFPLWAALGVAIPAAIGYAFGGWPGALTGFIWGGLVRILLGHHVTWCVNSVCHLWGSRPYVSDDHSRNNAVIGLLAMGEGWHNNHHAFPSSARHGLRWWQVDIAYWVIRALVLCRLAWKVRLPSAADLAARSRAPADAAG